MGLFQLIFRLGADATDFNASLERAKLRARGAAKDMTDGMRDAQKRSRAVGSQLDSQEALHTRFLRTAGAFVGGAAGLSFVRSTIQTASAINDMAAATGLGVEEVQEFDYALRMAGASIDDGARALRNLANAREAALTDPKGKAAQAFAQFGISQQQLQETSNPLDLMRMLSDAVKGVNIDLNSTPQILDLIGARGATVIPALVAGLDESASRARELNQIMSEDTVASLDAADDSVARLGRSFTTGLAPAISWVSDTILTMVDIWISAFTGIFAFIDKLPKSPKELIAGFKQPGGLLGIAKEAIAAGKEATIGTLVNRTLAREQEAEVQKERRKFRPPEPKEDEPRVGKKTMSPEEQALVDALRSEEVGLKKAMTPAESDQLTSVGNFLGSDPTAKTTMMLSEIEERLRAIESYTRETAEKGIVFR